jgi:hypothetical protein
MPRPYSISKITIAAKLFPRRPDIRTTAAWRSTGAALIP